MHEDVEKIARGLFNWKTEQSDIKNAICTDLEEETDRTKALSDCYISAVFALEKCQKGLRATSLWQEIVKSENIQSPVGQSAFRGLAAADVDASIPQLVRVLKVISKPFQAKDRINTMMDWLEMYLDIPGTNNALDSAYSSLKSTHRSNLISIMQERIDLFKGAFNHNDHLSATPNTTLSPDDDFELFMSQRSFRVISQFLGQE
jgi:hypothetical protein